MINESVVELLVAALGDTERLVACGVAVDDRARAQLRQTSRRMLEWAYSGLRREDMLVLRTSQAEIDELTHFYAFRDDGSPSGAHLVERYPIVVDVLLGARDTLRRIFPESAYYTTHGA